MTRDVAVTGHWRGDAGAVTFGPAGAADIAASLRAPLYVLWDAPARRVGLASGGGLAPAPGPDGSGFPLLAVLPAAYPEWLGDRGFLQAHTLRFAYAGGAMARGIASARLVAELAKTGALGFFGAAGLPPDAVEAALAEIAGSVPPDGAGWGSNLIHSPDDPGLEDRIVDIYLRHDVRRVSASAFMGLTGAVVRYACSGLRRDGAGVIRRRNHLFAKISREEVARHFLSPPPPDLLQRLVRDGGLTPEEAELAAHLPLADHITVEADSGGHTDNRPLTALFPAIMALRDELAARHGYDAPVRIGAAGGLGTPSAVAAAFALGASYVLAGSVHQAAVESGISDAARRMLADAGVADVMMTASADMFERGVKVQVLKRGAMMGVRGNQLYELYRRHDGLEDIPPPVRARLESQVFRKPLEGVWAATRDFFGKSDPAQLARAERDPKHKMALVFRWYLGNSSRWPITGEAERTSDYQIWCGPAMGSFNRWTRGSFLETPENRAVRQIALNLMEGAAIAWRAQQLRSFGVAVAADAFNPPPVRLRID